MVDYMRLLLQGKLQMRGTLEIKFPLPNSRRCLLPLGSDSLTPRGVAFLDQSNDTFTEMSTTRPNASATFSELSPKPPKMSPTVPDTSDTPGSVDDTFENVGDT